MPLHNVKRILTVNGADYPMVAEPQYDPKFHRYVAIVRRPNGLEAKAYSRGSAGPFVFTVPNAGVI